MASSGFCSSCLKSSCLRSMCLSFSPGWCVLFLEVLVSLSPGTNEAFLATLLKIGHPGVASHRVSAYVALVIVYGILFVYILSLPVN